MREPVALVAVLAVSFSMIGERQAEHRVTAFAEGSKQPA